MEALYNNGMVLVLLGLAAYFFIEYKAKLEKGGSLWYWLKDNWYNLGFTACCIAAYYLISSPKGTMATFTMAEKVGLFALGLMPNYFVDKLMDLVRKFLPKKDA